MAAEIPEDELLQMIGDLLSGAASEAEQSRLHAWLEESVEARATYRRYINLHVALNSSFAGQSLGEVGIEHLQLDLWQRDRAFNKQKKNQSWLLRTVLFSLATAATVALVWLATGRNLPMPGAGATTQAVASLTKTSGARWYDGISPQAREGKLRPGVLHLAEGLAELTFDSGVRMVLEGPVKVQLVSVGLVTLELGRVVAYVPEQARGFSVDTPRARVVDLGTEFGVVVAESGVTDVQVFEGEVVATLKDVAADAGEVLAAGNAVTIEAAGPSKSIPFEPQKFVRMFPAEDRPRQPGGPLYNRSRYDSVHVVAAPPGLAIDGNLADWNRSGEFASACMPPYEQSHYLEGCMMFDDEHLYLGAHVGDPAPMSSLVDPRNEMAWRGGSVIVRLSTMPDLGWPLDGKGPSLANKDFPDYGSRPQDLSDGIVHLTLWYHKPTESPRLHLSYGMDFHGEQANPENWEGAFTRDPDGAGYTLEYKIPWRTICSMPRFPQAGDTLAANWTVHWSDQEGKLSRGHLVEVTNFAEQPYRFLHANTWGKAIYHARSLPTAQAAEKVTPAVSDTQTGKD
jgi:ferric-dicitrate binding protein FerR (iron transport regulator)